VAAATLKRASAHAPLLLLPQRRSVVLFMLRAPYIGAISARLCAPPQRFAQHGALPRRCVVRWLFAKTTKSWRRYRSANRARRGLSMTAHDVRLRVLQQAFNGCRRCA